MKIKLFKFKWSEIGVKLLKNIVLVYVGRVSESLTKIIQSFQRFENFRRFRVFVLSYRANSKRRKR